MNESGPFLLCECGEQIAVGNVERDNGRRAVVCPACGREHRWAVEERDDDTG